MSTALVIGGGIAGLMSARALSVHFDKVVVLEQDQYPEDVTARKHVPQGHQVHVLLAEGYRLFQKWFPDFDARMDGLGVPEVDFGTHGIQFLGDLPMPRDPTGIAMRCACRPLLEQCIVGAVSARDNVSFRVGTKALGWKLEDGVVVGLHVEDEAGLSTLRADLVVDAAGRGTKTPAWLEEAGLGAPKVTKIDAGFGYVTGRFRPDSLEAMQNAAFMVCYARAPDFPLMGVIMKLHDGTVHGALIGAPGHHPPLEPDAFVARMAGLASPLLHEVVAGAEMVEAPRPYKNTANVRRHYERMSTWPGRFVALGDSAVTLNPRFGQGMTVAAVGAEVLHERLSQHGLNGLQRDPVGFAAGFQQDLFKATSVPWMMATADDLTWMTDVKLGLGDRVTGWYFKHMLEISTRDAAVHVRFMRVAQLLDAPTRLFAPDLVLRVLRRSAFGDPQARAA